MTPVDRIKDICKERKIAISRLEQALGFSNGYIRSLKNGMLPADKLRNVADYLEVSLDLLMTGEESNKDVKNIEYDWIINQEHIIEKLTPSNRDALAQYAKFLLSQQKD